MREGQEGLTEDLRASLGAWRSDPRLPLFSVLLFAGPAVVPQHGTAGFLVTLGTIYSMGWPGTERVWYRGLFAGATLSGRQALWGTFRFIPRFFVLGLVAALLSSPFFIGAYLLHGFQVVDDRLETSLLGYAIISLPLLVLDVLGTFVTPALAFTTRKVRQAVPIGVSMLRSEWRSAKWYALVPPLAVLLLGRLAAADVALAGTVSAVVGTLLNLAFKGAVVRFYMRRREPEAMLRTDIDE